ncbi:MAG TPA: hypothetical protein GXX35_11490 [Thermoanaerobacterales bacterium]|nr:hypothetical protein [Thermoanaerobacterales bacterium]
MGLKDIIQMDLDVFFNLDEFAESHIIDGRPLNVIVDNDRLQQRSQKEYDGIYVGDLLYFVAAKDYGSAPKPGSVQVFDGRSYTVFDVRQDMGVYEIILKLNAS